MKYKDYGFRPLYKNFCIFPLNSVIRNALDGEPGIEDADGVMVYGYVDHVEGNTVEFIALTKHIDDEKYTFIKLTDAARFFARMENLADEEFEFADYGQSHLLEQFKSKIDRLAQYDVNEDIVKSRTFSFLDEFRYINSFDDVKVVLHKDGLKLEGVWVKIESLKEGTIIGTVMNKPKQNFGVTTGSTISFIVNEDGDNKRTLISDLTERKSYSAEELADGKILKKALKTFKKDKNKFNFYAILEILKDSKVLIPQTKKGVEYLMAEKKLYFPIFSESLEMWQCEDGVQKVEISFIDAIKRAKKDKKLSGLVLNAYSDSIVIPRPLFEMLEGMVQSE